jgi:hypothetical protein
VLADAALKSLKAKEKPCEVIDRDDVGARDSQGIDRILSELRA